MGTKLIGSDVDAASNLTTNALTPRAWNFAVTANGVADTLYFKANTATTYKFGVWALSAIGGTPTTLLASTGSVFATAGSTYSIALSSPITMSTGQFYALGVKSLIGGSIKGTASPTANQRNSSADTNFSDPFDNPWSNTGGSSSSTPAIWLESTVVNITAIDEIESGSTSTMTLNSAAFAATNVKITNDSLTKTIAASGTATTFTFTAPSWIDGQTGLLYGACSVVANDGTNDTTAFTSTPTTVAAPLAVVTLTSVSANSLDKIGSFSPAWAVNTQVVYDSSKITVYANGECNTLIFDGVYWVDSGFEGVTQVWGRDPTYKIARMSNVTISDGAPVDPSESKFIGSTIKGRILTGSLLKGKLL